MEKIQKLNELRTQIESMEKHHQIEILKILSKKLCKINENKSGVYVNMSFLEEPILDELYEYISYVKDQEENLITTEYQKKEFRDSYFVEYNDKEDKDNTTITYSLIDTK
jgi:hypothetical protein